MTTFAYPTPLQQPITPQNIAKPSAKPTYDPYVDREFFLRCLIFGAENTGKHTLLTSSFPQEKTPAKPYARNDVDFVNKTLEIPYNTKRYHFWSFTVNEKSLKNEVIWRAYYKGSGAFVFVYDITNAESFKRLEEVVQKIINVVPENQFFGVLIGNKNDNSADREVSYDAAVSFKLKYGLAHFFETSNSQTDCGNSSELLESVESRLKMTFEAI